MRIVMIIHSLRSCWNHGDAHGVVEPADGWSAKNLAEEQGPRVLARHTCAHLVDEPFDVVRSLSPTREVP